MSNFSFSHSVFKRLVLQTCLNQGLFGKGLNAVPNDNIVDLVKLKAIADNKLNIAKMTISLLDRVELRKLCWNRRKCWLPVFSPFLTVFSTFLENFPPFSLNVKLLSAISFSLEESNICYLGKG